MTVLTCGEYNTDRQKVNSNIFRLYDIRGKYSSEVDEEVAYKIGTYFGSKAPEVLVGYDGRVSSDSLCDALTRGIVDAGSGVLLIGLVPTPLLYFVDKMLKPVASVMITASHNPKEYNGFKMILGGKPFFGEKLDELKKYVSSPAQYASAPISHFRDGRSMVHNYIANLLENIVINPKLKIAWDSGNGAAGNVVSLLLTKLSNQNIHINAEIDSNFPNRPPDQMAPGALDHLIKTVIEEKCDFGISFDGDGDRVVFVTSSGKVLLNDHLLCIFVRDLLQHYPGSTVIADVKTSQTFFDLVAKLGGKTIMSKTGHAFIKDLIKKTGALFAGELSGHIFFADKYHGFDDGIYAALRMVELLGKAEASLDELSSELPKSFATPEIKVVVKDEEKFQIVEDIKKQMQEIGREFIDIDGVRYASEHGWWLIRASNTESCIMARCESMTEEGLEIVQEDLYRFLPK